MRRAPDRRNKTIAKRLGLEVKRLRQQLGLTQLQVAQCYGIERRVYAEYEAGALAPRIGLVRLLKMMVRFDLTPDELDRET